MDTIATLGARFLGGALGSLGAAGLRGRGALGGAGVAIAGMAGGADVANGAKALYSGCELSSPVFKLYSGRQHIQHIRQSSRIYLCQ
jgi:hypothetical protein